MKIDETGIDFFIKKEGFKSNVYIDSGGAPTIGIGHKLTSSERSSGKIIISGVPIKYINGLTKDQIKTLFVQDLKPVFSTIDKYVTVELNQNQFNALASFIFNIGANAFCKSTLLKVLNNGQYDQVPVQLKRWVYDNGREVQGLKNRRNAEVLLWEGSYK